MARITASKIMVKTLKWVAILFFTSSIGLVLVYRFVPVPLTPLMLIRSAEQKMAGKPVVMEHDWVPMEEISPNLVTAVIASEDQNFTRHSGFDITAIEQAAKEYAEGRRKRGGSTISQQTAKNVFLWPQSSWVRKGFEAYFTFLIELFWSKERIMEVYLNSIEMAHETSVGTHRSHIAQPAEVLLEEPEPIRQSAGAADRSADEQCAPRWT